MSVTRCAWVPPDDALYIDYHDREWGVPLHDDRAFFERIVLEGAQAGLSWRTVLARRDHYRQVYDGFDPAVVARYDAARVAALLADPGIIRNRRKVESSIQNARAFLAIQAAFGSFDAYVWRFVEGQPRINHWRSLAEIPAKTTESRALSKNLKRRGFSFVGPTICYALMQACGLVNDHTVDCFRWRELGGQID
ncbi:MAG: DNA-3-methyladenine glycosylase I [Anaerolineae bacterium]